MDRHPTPGSIRFPASAAGPASWAGQAVAPALPIEPEARERRLPPLGQAQWAPDAPTASPAWEAQHKPVPGTRPGPRLPVSSAAKVEQEGRPGDRKSVV